MHHEIKNSPVFRFLWKAERPSSGGISVKKPRLFFPLTDILLFLQSWEQWLHSVLLPAHSCLLRTPKPAIASPPPAPQASPEGEANCTWKVTGVQCLLPNSLLGCTTSPAWEPLLKTPKCGAELRLKTLLWCRDFSHFIMVQHHFVKGNEKYSRNYSKLQRQLLGKLLLAEDN